MNKRILSLIITIFLILNNIIAISAATTTCKPEIDDYTVKNNVNMDITRIEQDDVVNMSIDIIDNLLKTSDVTSADNISVTAVDGSFGSPDANSIAITSTGSNSLKYTVNFKNITYSGSGNTISFKIKYKTLNLTSDKITLSVGECSERIPDTEDPITTSDKQPYVEISRNDISTPIKSNEDFNLILTIKNRGGIKMKRPVLSISLPDSIYALEGTGNIQIPDIEAGTSRNISLKLKAADYINSSSEEIDINLSYNYESPVSGLTSSTYTDRIFIPMVSTAKTTTPVIQITRGQLSAPIKGNEEFTLPIIVKNLGTTQITSPLLSFAIPDELMLVDDNSSVELNSLNAGESVNYNLKLKAKKYISASTQEVTADIKFNYMSENEITQGDASSKLIIPTLPNDSEGSAPLLQIVPETIENPLKSNSKFSVKVTINNVGTTDIKTGILTWDSGEGIIITDKTSSVNIGTIKAGESKEITLKGKTISKLTSTTQTITGSLKYKYESSKSIEQGEDSIKVIVPTLPDEDTDEKTLLSATPNIIISQYNYGGVPIANGNKFNFDVSFKNTSKTTSIENIVMGIETDAGLSITSASNTYFVEKLGAQKINSQAVEMQVLPNAETGSVKLTINFNYEYVENKERKQVSSSQSVSIPIYKPDKLEITLDTLPTATVGMEQTVSLNYVNKGKGELSNVTAEIVGDVTALTAVQNLGNFESGKSGTINFVVIPETPGEVHFTVKISYEDANLEQKVLEFPCVMNVEDYVEEVWGDEEFPAEDENTSHKGIIIGVSAGIIILIIIIVIIIKKRKKKKAASAVSVNWGAEDENQ